MLIEEMKSGDIATSENYAGLINTSAIQVCSKTCWNGQIHSGGKIIFNPVSINLRELVTKNLEYEDMAKSKNIELKSSFDDNLPFIADKNMINTYYEI